MAMATVATAMVTVAINNSNDGGGSGWGATAAVDSMVWGRLQAAEGAEMGLKQKLEKCGYDRQIFLHRKIVRGLLFICTLQCSLVTSQILALSEVKAIDTFGLLRDPPSYLLY